MISGLDYPAGITIDPVTSRLIWADFWGSKIQSSDLDGQNVGTIHELSRGKGPYGVAVHNTKLFWANFMEKTLQTSDVDGGNEQILLREVSGAKHLIIASEK